MSKNSNDIKVPCSKLLKDYNDKHIRSIADMSVNEVYTSLSKQGGIITTKCIACKTLLESLIKKVKSVMPSAPMTVEEQGKLMNLQTLWLAQLNKQINEVSVPIKPTYLRDVVTKILQERGTNEVCTNTHLEWYLEQHNGQPLDPYKIADAIVEHSGWDWSQVPHLKREKFYYITPTERELKLQESDDSSQKKRSRDKGKYNYILDEIEFIDSFPSTPGIESLDARLRNDIKVADEVLQWREEDADTYDYRVQFQLFLNRLQTLPDDAKNITFADLDEKTLKKMMKGKPDAKQKAKPKKVKTSAAVTKPDEPRKEEISSDGGNTHELEPTATTITTEQPTDDGADVESTQELTAAEYRQDEVPDEESAPFTPEEVAFMQDARNKENYDKLMSFLNGKVAAGVPYLGQNIHEENNVTYIKRFAARSDFQNVYNTLIANSNYTGVSSSSIMGYIRNVVLRNDTDWRG